MTTPGALALPLRSLLTRDRAALAGWWLLLQPWVDSVRGQDLMTAVDARVAAGAIVYPADPFAALRCTAPEKVRVVILGQDPYHGPGQAEGLAFSVAAGSMAPPSLRNIFSEIARDLGQGRPAAVSLRSWAQQGVLLLNTALTVEDGRPASHADWGWSALSDAIGAALWADPRPKVFLLWGAQAHACQRRWGGLAAEAASAPHLVLRANHPSPLSARRGPSPFMGCAHFSRCNQFLLAHGGPAIDWLLAPAKVVL